MRKIGVLALLAVAAASEARAVSVGAVAAVTTIAVNVLNIKKTIHDARIAARATKHGVVTVGKTVGKGVVKVVKQ